MFLHKDAFKIYFVILDNVRTRNKGKDRSQLFDLPVPGRDSDWD